MGWLRNFLRKRTRPIPKSFAVQMKHRLSTVYYFAAWNLFMLVMIWTLKYDGPETEDDKKHPSRYYTRILHTGDASVIKFRGLTKVGEYEIAESEKKDFGGTKAERDEAKRERKAYMDQMDEQRTREYQNLPPLNGDDEELLNEERAPDESVFENREDLNLLIEETNSL